MKITVQGKQMAVGAALSDHIDARLGHAVTKYFENALEAHVVISKDAHLFQCDNVGFEFIPLLFQLFDFVLELSYFALQLFDCTLMNE